MNLGKAGFEVFTSFMDFESIDSIILTMIIRIIVSMKFRIMTTWNRLNIIGILVIWSTNGYVILSTIYESKYANRVLFDTEMIPVLNKKSASSIIWKNLLIIVLY